MIKNIDPILGASPEEEQDALIGGVMTEDLIPEVSDVATVGLEEVAEPEGVEVAGLKDVFTTLGKVAKRTGEEDAALQKVVPDDTMQIVPTKGAIEGKPPERLFNLNRIDGPDTLKQHIDQVAQATGYKKEAMNMTALTDKVKAMGYSDSFVKRIADTNQKLYADPEESYKMMLAVADLHAKNQQLSARIAAGETDPELLAEFRQSSVLEGQVSRGALGKTTDLARSLRVLREARTASVDRVEKLNMALEEFGGADDVIKLAKAYNSLPTAEARHLLADRASTSGRITDIWLTTWINGILSSPVTHIKNITANAGYAGLNLAEKQIASLVGKTRNVLFNSEDYIRQQEIFVDMYSTIKGLQEGFALGRKAWKENAQVTGRSKIEIEGRSKAFDIEVSEDATEFQKMMAKSLSVYGKYVTMPGRALLTADEFFKATNYRRNLDSLAFREYISTRNEAIQMGDDIATAEKKAQQVMFDVSNNPPDNLHRESLSFAEEMTFTAKLEGKLGKLESLAQHPVAKIFVPFIRTPTNIAIALAERLPTAALSPLGGPFKSLSKKTYDDWHAGGIRRDMAIARVGLSGSLMAGVSSYALDGRVTGAGPYSIEQKRGLEATGWQPYSLVFDQNDVSDEDMAEFKKYTTVTSGNGKVFVSYAGLEPIGALMGIGATLGEYSIMEPDAKNIENLFLGAAMGAGDYITELPMIAGVSEFMEIFQGRGKEGVEYTKNIFKRVSEQAFEVGIGGSPVGAYSSLLNYTNRVLNPERRTPKATAEQAAKLRKGIAETVGYDIGDYADLDPVARGFIDAVGQYKARNPYLSPEMAPVLDPITGEQLKHAASSTWARAFPFKLSEQKYSPAYDVLNALAIGQYKPKKKIDGVELTPEQYNRWIEIATTTSNEWGKTLQDAIADLPYDQSFMMMLDRDPLEAQQYAKEVVSEFYSDAKQVLMDEEIGIETSADIKKTAQRGQIESRIEAMLP